MDTFIMILAWTSVVWIGALGVYAYSIITYITTEWVMCKIGFKGFGKYSLLSKDKSWPFPGRSNTQYMGGQ